MNPKSERTLFTFTTHHTSPSKPVQKRTMDMAALEDRSKDQKNRKHQHQMWPGKENSIPSGKRNSRGWCFFLKKKCMICSICLLVPWVAGKSQFLSGSNSFKKETIELDGSGKWPLRAVTTPRAKQNPVAHSSIARHFFKRYKDQEERDREEMAIKMNIAYIVVKEELPFSKCEGLVSPLKKEWTGNKHDLCQ